MTETRNSKTLASFVAYCEANPTQRFWQALRNWSGRNFIFVADNAAHLLRDPQDTFYWEGRGAEPD